MFYFYYSTLVGKEVAISPRLYDVEQKKVVGDFRFMGPGANSNGPLTLPPGKYEVKVYVGDVLVAVFPFRVQ
jgi:hypothetical protein